MTYRHRTTSLTWIRTLLATRARRCTWGARKRASTHPATLSMASALGAVIVPFLPCLPFLLLATLPLRAEAATLQISPVVVELGASENASGLTLRNPGDRPLYGQVRVFQWTQAEGEDVLTPTQDIVASPPLIEIPPHAEQLVRLVRPNAAPPGSEQSYRLLIDELPEPDARNNDGVMIRLRYSVPVFVEPPSTQAAPALAWSLEHSPQGWQLNVANDGMRRAQISAVELIDRDGKTHMLNKGLLGYALAGKARRWQVSVPTDAALGNEVTVRAAVNAAPVEAQAHVTASP
ncbi:fimbrial chaperone protein [Pararobbsia alpina]